MHSDCIVYRDLIVLLYSTIRINNLPNIFSRRVRSVPWFSRLINVLFFSQWVTVIHWEKTKVTVTRLCTGVFSRIL